MVCFPYRGYVVEENVYGRNEYTVQYCGDDYWFNTLEEAFEFIDEMEGA